MSKLADFENYFRLLNGLFMAENVVTGVERLKNESLIVIYWFKFFGTSGVTYRL